MTEEIKTITIDPEKSTGFIKVEPKAIPIDDGFSRIKNIHETKLRDIEGWRKEWIISRERDKFINRRF